MTSWSLTLLFMHFWICAFIVLYFYSISQKSKLTALFDFLFGPFSCSRKKKLISVSSVPSNIKDKSVIYLKDKSKQNEDEFSELKGLSDIAQPNNSNGSNKVEEINKNSQPNSNIIKSKIPKETYCDNKHECYLPSASVTSDANNWKLWIDSHVPFFVLFLIKLSWLFYNIIAISSIIVTVSYFTYVYIADLQMEPSWIMELGNIHRHGFNSLVAIIDIILLGYPVRILHFVYTDLYGWIYAFVTFLYWYQDPTKNIIYETLDYAKPITIVIKFTILNLLVLVMQILHFAVYQLKLYLKEKYLYVKHECYDLNCRSRHAKQQSLKTDIINLD
jgi:hypothetical protein